MVIFRHWHQKRKSKKWLERSRISLNLKDTQMQQACYSSEGSFWCWLQGQAKAPVVRLAAREASRAKSGPASAKTHQLQQQLGGGSTSSFRLITSSERLAPGVFLQGRHGQGSKLELV